MKSRQKSRAPESTAVRGAPIPPPAVVQPLICRSWLNNLTRDSLRSVFEHSWTREDAPLNAFGTGQAGVFEPGFQPATHGLSFPPVVDEKATHAEGDGGERAFDIHLRCM